MSRIVHKTFNIDSITEPELRREYDIAHSLFEIKLLSLRSCGGGKKNGIVCGGETYLTHRSSVKKQKGDRMGEVKEVHVCLRCYACRSYMSLYTGTIFSTSSKNILELIEIVRCWALNMTIDMTLNVLKMEHNDSSRQTIGKFFRQLRNVCTLALDKANIKLGGNGSPVEIDESLFAKVKHGTGKDLWRRPVWVFGMVERESSEVYFQAVPNRTAETLLSIIYEHTRPKTVVISDCWSSYNKISELHDQNLVHRTVNHSYNFVDPVTLASTNKIESLWCSAKCKFKQIRGCQRLYIQSYLDEYMWRHNNKVKGVDAFNRILQDAALI